MDKTAAFPKNMRFGMVQKIDGIALTLLEQFVEAIYSRDRRRMYQDVNINLEKLRVFLRLSHDRDQLSARQLRFAVGEIDEIGRMWYGWAGPKKSGSR